MSDLPPEIVADFLSRVPAQPLLRFRCVLKSWRAIIDNTDFIKTHLNRTIPTDSDRKLILRSWHLYSAHFDEFEKTNTSVYEELDHPLNRPGVGTILRDQNVFYGFGYDNVSDDYKVLRIAQSYDCESEVKVFSMKSNSWRKIHCFLHYLKYERAHGVQAAGALHWVVSRKPDSEMENLLAAFDLGTEEYRLVPEPNYSNERAHVMRVLGESLCVVCNYCVSFYIDIWVMKKYAVKESWTKLFRVAESDVRIKPLENVTPVAYSKSGREVFMVQNGTLSLWYDTEQRTISYSTFCISSVPILMEHELCFGSLVRLDGGVSGSWGVGG
ncbi:PREDICTED: F-box protein CPR30-like [Ipomoea nil]|uniref:F-box protein CPR30-like n=1 Tax=Ipomoea nil TaxID=35883 RepID=UPI000901685F|nr:PREDICTED: F-box protein CPR30-like [Ipomoea nil]